MASAAIVTVGNNNLQNGVVYDDAAVALFPLSFIFRLDKYN